MNRRIFGVAIGATAIAAAGSAGAALYDQFDLMQGEGVQNDWRHCNNCFSLFYGPEGVAAGVCAFGGHHVSQGFRYQVYFSSNKRQPVAGRDSQFDWRFCGKCWVMTYSNPTDPQFEGVCPVKTGPAGAHHQPHGFMFGLAHNNAANPGQSGWRFCSKCFSLFYGTAPAQYSTGFCPAGGKHTQASNSFDFDIAFTNNPGDWIDDIPPPKPAPGAYNPYYVPPGAGGTPNISVSASGGTVRVSGTGFAPGKPVQIRIVVNNVGTETSTSTTANGSGGISASFGCARGNAIAVSATDGRPASNATGVLWSNTPIVNCQ